MEIIADNDPWPHFIVTNFISSEMYLAAKQTHLHVTGEPKARNSLLFKREVDRHLYNDLETNFMSLLDQVGLPDLSGKVIIEFDALGPGFQYHPHTDIPTKIASFVYHVSDHGSGTKLLTDETSAVIKTLPWIVNGGGGFIRTKKSWHTFDNIGFSTVRRTILITLRK